MNLREFKLPAGLTVGPASVGFFQKLFTDSNRTGANLDKLVLLDVFQGHLKTHYSCRPDFGGVVLACGAYVGKLLAFCHVYRDVVFLAVFPDDLPLLNFFAGLDEKEAPVV